MELPMAPDESPPSILAKAFTLLRAFTPERRVMSLSEIGRASGLPKSTVHRLLARLVELGVIEHHRSGYRIGILIVQLGATAPAMGMREVAAPHLADLHHRTGLTVRLGVLRQFDVIILDKFSRRTPRSSPSGLGARQPANCSALGKALLAYEDLDDLAMFLPTPLPTLTSTSISDVNRLVPQLRTILAGGLARDVEEAYAGVASIAVPLNVMESAVASVSVAFPAGTPATPALEAVLRETAARIAGDVRIALGGRVHWFPFEIDEFTARAPGQAGSPGRVGQGLHTTTR